MDTQKYALEQALKQQIENSLVYGSGAVSTSGGSGFAGTGGAGGGGQVFTKSDLEDAIRSAYQNLPGNYPGNPPSGKEQCPVLYRLLSELRFNSPFSLRYQRLSVLCWLSSMSVF